MGVASKMIWGFIGLTVLASMGGNNGRHPSSSASASTGSGSSFADVASTYTNTVEGSSCHVSFNNFDQLQTGMSYDAAVGTLGCSGRELSRSDMAGYSTVMYGWDGSGSLGANMNAMFQNGRMVSKAQFGLH